MICAFCGESELQYGDGECGYCDPTIQSDPAGPRTLRELPWILGASDPEMARIEEVLLEEGIAYYAATARGAVRVTPRDAYASEIVVEFACVLVECGGPSLDEHCAYRIDHHREGDRGFGRPPAEYMDGSSLGQVLAVLGREPTEEDRLVAAADHCLAAAYAGHCPGVDPDSLHAHRCAERGAWLSRGPGSGRDEAREAVALAARATTTVLDHAGPLAWADAVRGAGSATTSVLAEAPTILLGGVEVLDLRELGTLPELPTALVRSGQAAVYRMVPLAGARDPRAKVGIIGAGEGSVPGRAPVAAFLAGEGPAAGLGDLYGDPARGFAGGYEETTCPTTI